MNLVTATAAAQGAKAFRTDKVFLEILNNRFSGITSEMGHIIHKASFTPFIKEAWDFGEGLVTKNGEIFGYPRDIGVGFMVAAMMEDAINAFDDLVPGDVIISNDHETSGGLCTHLPDIHLLKPYFYKGELICFTWTFIHSSDIGGMVPGSIALIAQDIYQEGLRIPISKLYRAGALNEDLMRIYLANCRISRHNHGDIQAMLSAMEVAERRLGETIEKYGLERVNAGIDDLLDYGEARARDVIARMPDGRYEMIDYMELDGTDLPPARIKLNLEVKGSGIHLDFEGTDSQLQVALNMPTQGKNHHFINAGIFNYIYAVDSSIPINRGILRPVTVSIPKGTLLNPEHTASVGVRFATTVRIMEMIFGALSQATDGAVAAPPDIADRVPAAGAGLLGVVLIALTDPDTGALKVNVVQPMWGGSGARPVKDGIDGADFAAGYLRNIPTETSEAEMPMLVNTYRLNSTPPSPGKWRGGLGIEMEFKVFAPQALVTARGMERFHFRPWGRKGGAAGSLGDAQVDVDTDHPRSIGKIVRALELEPNQVLRIVTSNGGGYGDAMERDPERVLTDVLNGYIDTDIAAGHYGVAIVADQVDAAATEAMRQARKASQEELPEFNFGPERDAFERKFPNALQDRLEKSLRRFPPAQRQYWKGRVWKALCARAGDGAAQVDVAKVDIEAILEDCVRAVSFRAPSAVPDVSGAQAGQ
jgi:N-methylhydantoinase B